MRMIRLYLCCVYRSFLSNRPNEIPTSDDPLVVQHLEYRIGLTPSHAAVYIVHVLPAGLYKQ